MRCTSLARQCMVLAIGIIHGCDLSNKMHTWLQPKKLKYAVLVVSIAAKAVYALYVTNKTECSSFESGYVVRMTKHLKEG